MEITIEKLASQLYTIAQANAPVRRIVDKAGRPLPRAVGKKGTNMYSPYPGNLKNNGIEPLANGIRYNYDKVGYIGYANMKSHSPQFIERTIDAFCGYCIALGGRIVKR